jgi:myo-inositol catabolism protein IolS
MKYIPLGETGVQISAIVLGGWQAGKEYWVGIDDSETIAAHRAALERGITTFDTAEEYGEGHSERILAEALSGERDRIVIATKVSWKHLRRDLVITACERSLRNLRTDHIDLYQIHWPAGSFGSDVVPIEETMEALVELRNAGKIRAIGVSNFSRAQLALAAKVGRIDAAQPCYSLFWRHFEDDALAYCAENKITVLAYSPLAQGLLTGRFGRGTTFPPEDNRADNKLFQGASFERALKALDALRPIAEARRVTLGQLALAWLIHRPNVAAIAGARNPVQAAANAAAGDVTLTQEEWDRIDQIGWTVAGPHRHDPLQWNW